MRDVKEDGAGKTGRWLRAAGWVLLCQGLMVSVPSSSFGAGESGAVGDAGLTVAAFTIPGLLEPDGRGLYADMMGDVARRTGIRIQLEILPIARARAAYRQGQHDCLLPLDPGFEDDYADHLQSVPLAEARAYLFTRPGTPALRGIKAAEGLRVGAELGVPYPAGIRAIIADPHASTLENLLKMLERGRFDAVLAYMPDMGAMAARLGVPMPSYDPQAPIAIYADSLTCRPTERNRELLNRINRALTDRKAEQKRS